MKQTKLQTDMNVAHVLVDRPPPDLAKMYYSTVPGWLMYITMRKYFKGSCYHKKKQTKETKQKRTPSLCIVSFFCKRLASSKQSVGKRVHALLPRAPQEQGES